MNANLMFRMTSRIYSSSRCRRRLLLMFESRTSTGAKQQHLAIFGVVESHAAVVVPQLVWRSERHVTGTPPRLSQVLYRKQVKIKTFIIITVSKIEEETIRKLTVAVGKLSFNPD